MDPTRKLTWRHVAAAAIFVTALGLVGGMQLGSAGAQANGGQPGAPAPAPGPTPPPPDFCGEENGAPAPCNGGIPNPGGQPPDDNCEPEFENGCNSVIILPPGPPPITIPPTFPPCCGADGLTAQTDATVTYSAVCIDGSSWRATVTVKSSWDGVTHIVVDNPQGPMLFDVPGYGTASGNIVSHADSLFVRVSSSNAHLQGTLTHTFTRPPGCVVPTTTSVTVVNTAPPNVIGDTPTTLSPSPEPTVVPPSSSETTAAPAVPAVRLAPPVTTPLFLPATGAAVDITVYTAAGLIAVGLLLLVGRYIDRRKTEES